MESDIAEKSNHAELVEAMKAIGLTDATGPLYDLVIPGGIVPRVVKLDFRAISPDHIFGWMIAQVYQSGHVAGAKIAQAEIRNALGIRD